MIWKLRRNKLTQSVSKLFVWAVVVPRERPRHHSPCLRTIGCSLWFHTRAFALHDSCILLFWSLLGSGYQSFQKKSFSYSILLMWNCLSLIEHSRLVSIVHLLYPPREWWSKQCVPINCSMLLLANAQTDRISTPNPHSCILLNLLDKSQIGIHA